MKGEEDGGNKEQVIAATTPGAGGLSHAHWNIRLKQRIAFVSLRCKHCYKHIRTHIHTQICCHAVYTE